MRRRSRDARDLLAAFLALLDAWDPTATPRGPRLDLAGVARPALEIMNEMLGEGEVSIQIDGARKFRIQESVFTGLWRVCALDGDGRLARDWLEAGMLPGVAVEIAQELGSDALPSIDLPPGAMNSPALLAEIGSQMATRKRGAAAHVINLTLFPMTPEDHAVLEQALPVGPVAMISRGFGNCHVTSTGSARCLARPVLQQHEHADPQHHRSRRRAGSRARRRRRSDRQPRHGSPNSSTG